MRAILLALPLLIAGCFEAQISFHSRDVTQALVTPQAPTCKGALTEMSGQRLEMRCDDGTIITYKTYKYNFNRSVNVQ